MPAIVIEKFLYKNNCTAANANICSRHNGQAHGVLQYQSRVVLSSKWNLYGLLRLLPRSNDDWLAGRTRAASTTLIMHGNRPVWDTSVLWKGKRRSAKVPSGLWWRHTYIMRGAIKSPAIPSLTLYIRKVGNKELSMMWSFAAKGRALRGV